MTNNPEFIMYVGPMFSTKTSKLLMALERYKHQHKKVAVFKPQIDDRYSASDVVSHSGWSAPATTIKNGVEILKILTEEKDSPHVVAVDEAFMIPGIAEVLVWLYRNGFNVIVATLDIGSAGKPFHEVEKMLSWATHVEKCTSVCTACGADAHYTYKKQIDDGEEIHVGGAELYEPRCARCHPAILSQDVVVNKNNV